MNISHNVDSVWKILPGAIREACYILETIVKSLCKPAFLFLVFNVNVLYWWLLYRFRLSLTGTNATRDERLEVGFGRCIS